MTELEWFQCANPHAMLQHLMKGKRASPWSVLSWLGFRREKDRSRQQQLFAIACCRRIESLLIDQRSRYALEIAEKLADGSVGKKERSLAVAAANAAAFDASSPQISVGGWLAAAQARAAEAVAAALVEHDPASVTAARAKEAVRSRAKARPIPGPGRVGAPGVAPAADLPWNSAVIVTAATAESPRSSESVLPPEEAAWTLEATIQCEFLRDIFGNPFQPVTLTPKSLQKSAALALARRIDNERAFGRLPEIAEILASEGIQHPDLLAHCRQPGNHLRGCWVIDLLLGR